MLIGRTSEIARLKGLKDSNKAEFLVIYGRRRIGKTFLVRSVFEKETNFLEFVGQKDAPLSQQLKNFHEIFAKRFYPNLSIKEPTSWNEAFQNLTREIEKGTQTKPFILFFDELPWLCSRKSGFLQALDFFWNKYWSQISNVRLIVCGSAAGWMIKNIVGARGGLHHRLTQPSICLDPFTLKETKEFLKAQKIRLSDMGILELYMVLGGVPYYLSLIPKGSSLSEVVDYLFFQDQAPLRREFTNLFHSLYENADKHIALIREISSAHYGLTRSQLIAQTKQESGGRLAQRLNELEAAGFIHSIPFMDKKRDKRYRIKDPFIGFYLKWVDDFVSKNQKFSAYWDAIQSTGAFEAWIGLAFEHVCFVHTDQIIKSLNLQRKIKSIGSWWKRTKDKSKNVGAQIDFLIERTDKSYTMAEIKFSRHKITIDKSLALKIKNRLLLLSEAYPGMDVFTSLISPLGIKKNTWSEDLIDQQVTLSDLMSA